MTQPLWSTIWRVLKKLKIELPYDPAAPFLSIYLEKTIILKDSHTLFTEGLFTVARTQKQGKSTLREEWIKKMLYIYI